MASNKLSIYRGDDASIQFTIKDEDGDAIDITNDTIFFTVKTAKNSTAAGSADSTALIEKENGVGGHTTPTSGITTFTLTDADTAIAPGTYYYDVQRVDSGGLVSTIVVDEFEILAEVTTDIA